jgi:hypothetical protein
VSQACPASVSWQYHRDRLLVAGAVFDGGRAPGSVSDLFLLDLGLDRGRRAGI